MSRSGKRRNTTSKQYKILRARDYEKNLNGSKQGQNGGMPNYIRTRFDSLPKSDES